MGLRKPNSFVSWIENKLDDESRALLFRELLGYVTVERNVLIEQLLGSMSMTERGDLVESIIDELNNQGYDWGVFSSEEEVG